VGKITDALKKVAEEKLERIERRTEARYGYVVTQKVDSKVDPRVVAYHEPNAPISEQYKILRTNIQSLSHRRNFKTFVISSSMHGEGKTITATNLAFVMAEDLNSKSVLLVDADLRKGRISRLLGLGPRPGLVELLSDGTPLSDTLIDIGVKNLTVLPSGKFPKNPAELLGSSKMKQILNELRQQFDVIFFDAPPIINVTDPGVLGAQCDGVFFVVQAGRTQRGSVQHGETLLTQAHAKILGYVLTNVEYHLPEYLYRYVESQPVETQAS
jgi:capsular exopolysaccharide synthesis family protein